MGYDFTSGLQITVSSIHLGQGSLPWLNIKYITLDTYKKLIKKEEEEEEEEKQYLMGCIKHFK
jgi:hypothetical protein